MPGIPGKFFKEFGMTVCIAVMFSLVILPFVYFPILKAARDKSLLGKHTNSPALNIASWSFFAILCIVALSAIPLLLLTKGGLG